MDPKRLFRQTLYTEVSRKRSVKRPRTKWLDYTEDVCSNRCGLHSSKMQLVDQELWWLNWSCCPRNPQKKWGKEKKKLFLVLENGGENRLHSFVSMGFRRIDIRNLLIFFRVHRASKIILCLVGYQFYIGINGDKNAV